MFLPSLEELIQMNVTLELTGSLRHCLLMELSMFLPSINELLQVNVTLKLTGSPRHCLLMELINLCSTKSQAW